MDADAVCTQAPVYCWYAVYTHSHFEVKCARDLAAKQIEHYMPAFQEKHHWSDREVRVQIPLFPSYLFVRIDGSAESQVRVMRTSGVVRILGQGGNIEAVPEEEISSLRRMLWSGNGCKGHPGLVRGAKVRVVGGPLRGLVGELVRMKSEDRLVCSVQLLSRSVSSEIDIRDVRPLGVV